MNNNQGVMEQIKDHFAGGLVSRQVIGLGYPPSTVFKVQAQMRKKGQLRDNRQPQRLYGVGRATSPSSSEDLEMAHNLNRLTEENVALRTEVETLREQVGQMNMLQAQLDQSRTQVRLLESGLSEVPGLKAQVDGLEQRLAQATEEKDRAVWQGESYQQESQAMRLAKERAESELLRAKAQLKDKDDQVVRLERQLETQTKVRTGLEQEIAELKAQEERRKQETCPECGCPWERHRDVNDLILGERKECPPVG